MLVSLTVQVYSQLIDLILVNELSESNTKDNNIVIMAGGKGLRIRPYTENCPKPMLKVSPQYDQ